MTSLVWVELVDALAIHARVLSIHGGPDGIRDQALLGSALARPHQLQAYNDGARLVHLAAAYTFGIVRNHPFVDGNKRTGFVVGVLFLELNGSAFIASEEDAAQAVVQLAAGKLEESHYADFLLRNSRKK